MKKPDTIERDVDRIRLKLYHKTKNMTDKQFVDYFNKSGEALAKKYGFIRIESADSYVSRASKRNVRRAVPS